MKKVAALIAKDAKINASFVRERKSDGASLNNGVHVDFTSTYI